MACIITPIDELFLEVFAITKDEAVATRIVTSYNTVGATDITKFLNARYNKQSKFYEEEKHSFAFGSYKQRADAKRVELLQRYDLVSEVGFFNDNYVVNVHKPVNWNDLLKNSIEEQARKDNKKIDPANTELGISPLTTTNGIDVDYMAMPKSEVEETSDGYVTILKDIDARINRKQHIIASDKSDKAKIARLDADIKVLEAKRNDISDAGTLLHVINHGLSDIKQLSKLFTQDTLSVSELREADKVLYMWENIPLSAFFSEKQIEAIEPSTNLKAVSGIKGKIGELRLKHTKAESIAVVQAVQDKISDSNENQILGSKKEISGFKGKTFSLNTMEDVTAQAMYKFVSDADYDMTQEVNKIMSDVDRLDTEVRKTSVFKQQGYKFMAQELDGKDTGDILHRFDQSFFKQRGNLLYAAKKNGGKAWSRFFKWKKENNIIFDLRKLFPEEYQSVGGKKIYSDKQRNEHIDELKRHLGEKGYNYYFDGLKDSLNDYKGALEAATDHIDNLEGDMAEKAAMLNTWIIENSPFHYAEYVYDGIKHKVGSDFVVPKGSKYTVEVPKRFDSKGKLTGYYDKKFEVIEANDALYSFYRYAIEKFNEIYDYMPDYAVENLQYNTLPEIHKTILETFKDDGTKAGFQGWYDKVLGEISEKERTVVRRDIDPTTGEAEKAIPMTMLSQSLSPSEKSYDIPKIIKAFSLQGLSFKHKSKIEDSIRLLQKSINKSKEMQLSASGKELTDKDGNPLGGKDGLTNLKSAVNYFVEASFYGNRKKSEGVSKTTKYTFKEQKELDEINEQLKDDRLSNEEKTRLEAKKAELGSHIVTSKVMDKVLTFALMKGMAWNPFAASSNVMFSYVANVTHAAGGEDFTIQGYHNALRTMLHTVGKSVTFGMVQSKIVKKIHAVFEKLNVVGEINQAAYADSSHNNSTVKGISKLGPMELTRRAEFLNQGSTAMAMLKHAKVKDLTGKERSLWEALDEEGNWNDKEFGAEPEQLMKDFKSRLDAVKEIIHGNYNTLTPIQLKQTTLGRAVMMFRGWVAPGIAARFQDERTDQMLGRQVKGRLRTWNPLTGGSIGHAKGWVGLLDQMANFLTFGKAFGKSLNTLSEVDKANMKKNAAEVMLYISIYLLILSLKHAGSDDDDEKYALNAAINLGLRTQNDMAFFTSPMAFEKISQSIIPAFSIVTDGYNFLSKASVLITGGDDEYNKSGPGYKKGDSKTWRAFMKFNPGTSAIIRTKSLLDRIDNR